MDPYIIAIGASAGGVEALTSLLPRLDPELNAAVLVVVHMPARRSVLDQVLRRASRLPTGFAEDGDSIRRGRIYLAPPDVHLLVDAERLLLRRGPVENNSRPAIDPLFRSVAVHHRGRGIGVVLSGNLSDGSSGLAAIKRCGGRTVVQDPADARNPDMPRNAIAVGPVDHVMTVAAMPELLAALTSAEPGPGAEPPADILLEARIAASHLNGIELPGSLGARSVLSCPECQGALWEIREGRLTRYRCHTGHAFALDVLAEAQISELDRALGSALRVIDERIHILRKLAEEATERQRPAMARQWESRVAEYEREALLLRDTLMARKDGDAPSGGS